MFRKDIITGGVQLGNIKHLKNVYHPMDLMIRCLLKALLNCKFVVYDADTKSGWLASDSGDSNLTVLTLNSTTEIYSMGRFCDTPKTNAMRLGFAQ